MANFAILIGVSDYQNISALPACKNDLNLMQLILQNSKKYNEVFVSFNESSAILKEKLTQKLDEWQQETIEEVFFYFTGHGHFKSDEFYYILQNYDAQRLHQTTLSNTEIDQWLRTLQATLTIKVVDACESGFPYIKDITEPFALMEKNIEERFDNCYFMFSSSYDQPSLAGDKLSLFTQSFVEAVTTHETNSIRYREVMDYIADYFNNGNHNQKPRFVIQGDNIEVFISNLTDVKTVMQTQLLLFQEENSSDDKSNLQTDIDATLITLKDRILSKSQDYATEKDAIKLLDDIRNTIESYPLPKDLEDIFTLNTNFVSLAHVPKPAVIGRWLDDNQNKNYFAVPIKRDQRTAIASSFFPHQDYDSVYEGFKKTTHLPYDEVTLFLKSDLPNLLRYKYYLVLIFSNMEVVLFYTYTKAVPENWSKFNEITDGLKWTYSPNKIKNNGEILKAIYDSIKNFYEFVISDVETAIGED